MVTMYRSVATCNTEVWPHAIQRCGHNTEVWPQYRGVATCNTEVWPHAIQRCGHNTEVWPQHRGVALPPTVARGEGEGWLDDVDLFSFQLSHKQ